MRTSTTAMGMLGGVGLALALVAPLYVGLPSHYVNHWMYMTPGGGQAGVVLAAVVLAGTGFLAGALTRNDPVRAGAGASALASVLGATWMLSPGITVEALRELLRLDPAGDAREAATEALTQVMWYPATASLGLLVGGPALGALAGVAYDLWAAGRSRPPRVVRPSLVPFAGMLATTAWGAVLAWLVVATRDQIEPLGATISTIKLSAAPAILGLWTTIFLCWALRDAVLWFRAQRQLRGTLWALAGIALGLLTLTPLAYAPDLASSPAVIAAGAAALVAALVTLFGTARADVWVDPDRRGLGDVLVEAALVGALTVALGVLTVGPPIFAEQLIVNPRLAQLAGEPATPMDAASVVQWLFRYHWASVLPMTVVAAGWAMVRLPTMWIGEPAER